MCGLLFYSVPLMRVHYPCHIIVMIIYVFHKKNKNMEHCVVAENCTFLQITKFVCNVSIIRVTDDHCFILLHEYNLVAWSKNYSSGFHILTRF